MESAGNVLSIILFQYFTIRIYTISEMFEHLTEEAKILDEYLLLNISGCYA